MVDRSIDLSDAQIVEGLKPLRARGGGTKPVEYRDKKCAGLSLRVTSAGGGNWTSRYRIAGKQRRVVYGASATMNYTAAVSSHLEAQELIKLGLDPVEEIKARAQKAAQAAVERRSFLAERPKVSDAIENYIKSVCAGQKSGQETARYLRKHMAHALGDIFIEDLKKLTIKDWLEAERAELVARKQAAARKHNQANPKDLRPVPADDATFTAINRLFAAVSSCLQWAASDDGSYIENSPMPKLTKGKGLLKAERGNPRTLSDAEIKSFWENVELCGLDDKTVRALKLILLTGHRPGEILSLRVKNINFSEQIVDERPGREGVRGFGVISLDDSKNNRPIKTPMTETVRAVLAPLVAATDQQKDDLLFPCRADKSKPISTNTLAKAMKRKQGKLGLLGDEKATPHKLRGTAAEIVLKKGLGAAAAEVLLAHANETVLRENYTAYAEICLKLDCIEAIDKKLSEVCTPTAPLPPSRKKIA